MLSRGANGSAPRLELDAHLRIGLRHQLHEAERAFGRHGDRIAVALHAHDGLQPRRRQTEAQGSLSHQASPAIGGADRPATARSARELAAPDRRSRARLTLRGGSVDARSASGFQPQRPGLADHGGHRCRPEVAPIQRCWRGVQKEDLADLQSIAAAPVRQRSAKAIAVQRDRREALVNGDRVRLNDRPPPRRLQPLTAP